MRKLGVMILLGLPWLLACRLPVVQIEAFPSVASPGGARVAAVVSRLPPGGALQRAAYYVLVYESSKDAKLPSVDQAVWYSNDVYPVYLFWKDDDELEVLVARSGEGRFDSIRVRELPDLAISTRVLESTSKAAICDSSQLEEIQAGVL